VEAGGEKKSRPLNGRT